MSFQAQHLTPSRYRQEVEKADKNSSEFWKEKAEELVWIKKFHSVLEGSFETGKINWFKDGTLNPSVNCLDRHVKNGHGDKIAFFYQSVDGKDKKEITYRQLLEKVCLYANVMNDLQAKKGDRVIIYMPMGLEVVAVMLACARMGLVHSVVFAGFSAQSLALRIEDCGAKFLVTANSFSRGEKSLPLYKMSLEALSLLPKGYQHPTVLVHQHNLSDPLKLDSVHYHLTELEEKLREKKKFSFEPVEMHSGDPLFILYTSGSTGRPKGLVHTCGGYLTYAQYTFKNAFDYRQGDIYWCTADVGWITGHTYIVYGPLACGATSLIYEGALSYPNWGRTWSLVEEYKVNIFYTAPTAIRSFMAQGEEWVEKYNLESLRLLGTVGEPINPEAWHWYHKVIGKKNCPIVDTWWQTETGGIMITPLAGIDTSPLPGYATRPLPGISTVVFDEEKRPVQSGGMGALTIGRPWPGMAHTIYGDHQRFVETYFSQYPGYYFTGDGCEVTKDGLLRITGRIDDVINVSGHRLGTAEVESALITYPGVVEAAAIAIDDAIKGQNIFCYVCMKTDHQFSHGLEIVREELKKCVAREIGSFARPKEIIIVNELPKTRSGKIMRRILRLVAEGQTTELGDLSTLAVPEVIEKIIQEKNDQLHH